MSSVATTASPAPWRLPPALQMSAAGRSASWSSWRPLSGRLHHQPAFFGTADALSVRAARRRPLRRDGGRHDLRHRQQGPRPVGRLDLGLVGDGLLDRSSRRPISTSAVWRWPSGPRRRARGRADQRRAGDLPEGAGVHRDADHAVHRPRPGARPHRRQDHRLSRQGRGIPGSSRIGETNALGFNNQILVFLVVAVVGARRARQDRWGYETFAVGGNEQAAELCRHPHPLGAHARLSCCRRSARRSPA